MKAHVEFRGMNVGQSFPPIEEADIVREAPFSLTKEFDFCEVAYVTFDDCGDGFVHRTCETEYYSRGHRLSAGEATHLYLELCHG